MVPHLFRNGPISFVIRAPLRSERARGVGGLGAKISAAGGKGLLDDIAKITPKPVTVVILTHSDGDHVNGVASFPAGVKVIAHENNKKEQEKALAQAAAERRLPIICLRGWSPRTKRASKSRA